MKIKYRTKISIKFLSIVLITVFAIIGVILIIYKCIETHTYNKQQQHVEIIKNDISTELDTLTGVDLIRRCEFLSDNFKSISVGNEKLDHDLSIWIKTIADNKLSDMAELGDIDACFVLGEKWELKAIKCSDDEIANSYYQRAAYWFKQNADKGGGRGAAKLSEYYLYGRGISKNEVSALKYARIAANYNNPEGLLLMGDFFHKGVIQEYEWIKDSTCFECVRDGNCRIHTTRVNKVIIANNNDSARWYWKKVIEQTRKGPGYFHQLNNRAKTRLEKIYE